VLHHPPSSQKTATAVFFMRRVHPPTRCQAGTRLLHPWLPSKLARSSPVSHAGSKGSNILLSSPPMQPCSPTPLETRTPPGVLRVGCGTVNPPSNIENDAIQLISKNSKIISIVSQNRISGLMLSVCWTGQQEVHHYAGWSIPGPRPLYAHIQEGNALVQGAELGLTR